MFGGESQDGRLTDVWTLDVSTPPTPHHTALHDASGAVLRCGV